MRNFAAGGAILAIRGLGNEIFLPGPIAVARLPENAIFRGPRWPDGPQLLPRYGRLAINFPFFS